MAVLPDQRHRITSVEGTTVVLSDETGETVDSFRINDPNSFGPALQRIWFNPDLSDECKCFAAFWCGYFYAHADVPDLF